jgi:hypothetical protein
MAWGAHAPRVSRSAPSPHEMTQAISRGSPTASFTSYMVPIEAFGAARSLGEDLGELASF